MRTRQLRYKLTCGNYLAIQDWVQLPTKAEMDEDRSKPKLIFTSATWYEKTKTKREKSKTSVSNKALSGRFAQSEIRINNL